MLTEGLRRMRPAPLASTLARLTGLNKREMVHTNQGIFFVTPMSNLGFHLRRDEYEPATTAILNRHLTPGAVFVDLGANEGYFSVVASRLVGPEGMVIAVEPQSRLQSVIRANLKANDCRNVRVIKAVVSSKTEVVDLELSSDINTGSSSLFRHTKYPLLTEKVQSFTLGELFHSAGVHRCDLMKVDIEGAEYDALIGAQAVLESGIIRHMAIEVHNPILSHRGLSWDQAHDVILKCGYKAANELAPGVYSFAG